MWVDWLINWNKMLEDSFNFKEARVWWNAKHLGTIFDDDLNHFNKKHVVFNLFAL